MAVPRNSTRPIGLTERLERAALSIFAIVASLFIDASPAWSAEKASAPRDSKKSIEELLHESEKALLEGNHPVKPPSRRRKGSPSQAAANPTLERERKIDDALRAPPKSVAIAPIDTTAIQDVVTLDLNASKREREPLYPILAVSLSLGIHSLSPVYSMMKDDDNFTNENGGQLTGLYLSFNPTWGLDFLSSSKFRTTVSAVFQFGYSQGNVVMRRSGIQPGTRSYGMKLFPVDTGIQLSVEGWNLVGVFAGYGPALEALHQSGVGVNDTMTQIFYGDEAWVGLTGKVFDSAHVFMSYRKKGVGLLFRSPNLGGQLISAGIIFALLG